MDRWQVVERERRLAEARAFLGGVCVSCRRADDLQFDHIDPTTKLFGVSKAGATVALDRFWAEVRKCQLLCKTCHYDKTSADLISSGKAFKHGTRSMYDKHGCRCADCCAWKSSSRKPRTA